MMMRNDAVLFQFTGPMGVRVEVGQSLAFLVGLILFLSRGNILHAAIFAALLVLAIFLHELGHAWGCKVQGVPVRRIMIHGGGGFCERSGVASRQQEELIVAMGPIVNLALWALASLLQTTMISNAGTGAPPSQLFYAIYGYLGLFAFLNLAMFIFNLIPVQPLDGGKLFHLFMLRIMQPNTAHRVTGWVGLTFAVLWIPAAVLVWMSFGWILFFLPSIPAHYRMAKGELA